MAGGETQNHNNTLGKTWAHLSALKIPELEERVQERIDQG